MYEKKNNLICPGEIVFSKPSLYFADLVAIFLTLSTNFSTTSGADEVLLSTETSDLIVEFLRDKTGLKRESQSNGGYLLKMASCVITEITIPSTQKISKEGFYSMWKHILDDIFTTVVREANLIPGFSAELPSEDKILSQKLSKCMAPLDLEEGGFGEGRGGGGGYGGYKDPILGFSLLGLKVLGGLIAFLVWDLNNNMG